MSGYAPREPLGQINWIHNQTMRCLPLLVLPIGLAGVLLGTVACGSRDDTTTVQHDVAARDAAADAGVSSSGLTDPPRIVILGDSLTAGLGLPVDEAYPALLQRRVQEGGLNYEVVNAGVSGDTSAGGLSRLDWALEGNVKVLVLALGANDGLRGVPVDELKRNLDTIIKRSQARGVTVVLAGMEAPPNFGRQYTKAFHDVYPDLASQYRLALVPFLLQGVAAVDALNQGDGLHPNSEGAQAVADNVWAVLETTLRERTVRD